MEDSTRVQHCCTTPSAVGYWLAVFLVLFGGGLWLRAVWPAIHTYGDTLILVALGLACLVNFRRNRTLHCILTGPLFLAGAVIAALIESGVWHIDERALWGVVLVGVVIAFVIEWRSVRGQRLAG